MNYNKTTWDTGDIVTAEKLNNIEDGIASAGDGIFIVSVQGGDNEPRALDKTYAEIVEAFNSGKTVVILQSQSSSAGTAVGWMYLCGYSEINSGDFTTYGVGFTSPDVTDFVSLDADGVLVAPDDFTPPNDAPAE